MQIRLAFGKQGLHIDIPDHNVTILEPKYIPGLSDETGAIRGALQEPIGCPRLAELAKIEDTVAIVFSDITRPQPRDIILPVLLEEISHIPKDQITLINALGTHRQNTLDELSEMLGNEIVADYKIIQHDAWDRNKMIHVGTSSHNRDIYLNAEYMEADIKILTGFIEPHFFAGFTGGPKAVFPGLTYQPLVMANHGSKMIADSRATWCITAGNPIWEEMREAALMSSPTFLVDVALNRDQKIIGVFAGDLLQAHSSGVQFVKSNSMMAVQDPFDIVITSNSGYPLDLNLYQTVKGMSAASQVVKRGGSIIIASECWDGLPEHGEFATLLQMAESPRTLLSQIQADGFQRQDQWQVQILAQILLKADVFLYSTYLDKKTVKSAMLNYCDSIEDTIISLLKLYGPEAKICVLPEGPRTIPYIEKSPL